MKLQKNNLINKRTTVKSRPLYFINNMKNFLSYLIVCTVILFTGCSQTEIELNNIIEPEKISTGDEIYPAQNVNSVEESDNVNGQRFALTLNEFTIKYNEIIRSTGFDETLNPEKWKTKGSSQTDSNGVEIQYYYYDAENINFTATVEVYSAKILNIGCGTTMGYFVAQNDDVNNSDIILKKCAIMAQAVCQFPDGSLDLLQDIFYRTTFENADSLWYQGFIFSLDTQENKSDSSNNIMLMRVFPVSDDIRKEWEIPDYEEYSASIPHTTTAEN